MARARQGDEMTEAPTQPPRPGRPKQLTDEQRQALVLDAAEHVFLEKGYHASTMADVALQAKMSKKTIYQVFSTKAELFDGLFDERLSVLTLPAEEDADPPAVSLEKLLLKLSETTLAPRNVSLLGLLIAEVRQSKVRVQALNRLGLGQGSGTLEKWFALQKARGTMPIDDPIEAANMIWGLALGDFQMFTLLKMRKPPSRSEVRRRITKAVAIFMNGLLAYEAAKPEGNRDEERD
jgi:TetR/AcrR family transcriptional regulator of autoinduction and epiphytic fitness